MQPNTRMTFRFEPLKPTQPIKPIQQPPQVKARWTSSEEKLVHEEIIELEYEVKTSLNQEDMVEHGHPELNPFEFNVPEHISVEFNEPELDLPPNHNSSNIMNTFTSWNSPFQDDIHALEDIIRKSEKSVASTIPNLGSLESEHGMRDKETTASAQSAVQSPSLHSGIVLDKQSPGIKGFSSEKQNDEGLRNGYRLDNGSYIELDREDSQHHGDSRQSSIKQENPSWGRVFISVSAAIATGALFGYLVLSLFTGEALFPSKSNENIQSAGIQANAGMTLQPSKAPKSVTASAQANANEKVTGTGTGTGSGAGTGTGTGNGTGSGTGTSSGSGETSVTTIPAEDYFLLQYGVFQSRKSMDVALKQLQDLKVSYTIDQTAGYRVYLGAARTRDAAELLAAQLSGVELYIKPVKTAALNVPMSTLTDGTGQYIKAAAELMGIVTQYSSYYLQDQKPEIMDEADSSALEEAHQRLLSTTSILSQLDKTAQEDGSRLTKALKEADLSLKDYNQKPSRFHLWEAQSEAMKALIAYNSLLNQL